MKYLQVQSDGTITDCISFPHGDYVSFEGETPQDIMGGWYKLIDGKIVEFPELRPKDLTAEFEELKAKNQMLEMLISDIDARLGGLK